jgi:hypothetical protein
MKDFYKKVLGAWREEFGDIKNASNVLLDSLSSKFSDKNKKPTDEELREALRDLASIPKIAPLIAIIITSPIPGSSIGYLTLVASLKKMTNNKINLVPKRFDGLFDKDSSK